ncbi:TIGR02186 family protein [Pseudooceanicola sp. C21-150M6]|uniref:TIGR02186 family protein n=1 Tax=Pseudooceanicola sp. C21-150M6 TaxID=3434355 RepID=UPI003D7F92C9
MTRLLFLLISLLLPFPLLAQEEVVLGLSQDRVRITANFDGSEILIFGAVKRESPVIDPPLDVIVTIAGPAEPLVIHKKDRRVGVWVNAQSVYVSAAPSFYAVASSGPLAKVLRQTEDLRHSISIPRAIRAVGAASITENPVDFTQALIRIREDQNIYQNLESSVQFDQQTLFRTRISLPANLTEGQYDARVFLLREGHVVSRFDTGLEVRKVGLERWLYLLANNQPLAYGLLSLAIAIAAGWLASTFFRVIRSS